MHVKSIVKKIPKSISAERFLFYATTTYAGLLFQLAPHLPMVDIPQHAAQIALLKGLLTGHSAWGNIVQTNYITPYLLPMMSALGLSYLMEAATAINTMLTLSFYLFVWSYVALRKHFKANPHADWLLVPSYFGFSYNWGLYSFLVTSPLAAYFILIAHQNAMDPTKKKSIRITIINLLLLLSHGGVYLYANTVGFLTTLAAKNKPLTPLTLYPFFLTAILFCAYIIFINHFETNFPSAHNKTIWDFGIERLFFVSYSWSMSPDDLTLSIIGSSLFITPLLLGLTIRKSNLATRIPLYITLAIGVFVPSFAFKTAFLYQRFSLFLLPSFSICLHNSSDTKVSSGFNNSLKIMILPALCLIFLIIQTQRIINFKQESREIDQIISSLPPNYRALSLIFDKASDASQNYAAYLHYPLWYQAERNGFVDFNFAYFLPNLVRFKPNQLPSIEPIFAFKPESFHWIHHKASVYRYFFVRSADEVSKSLFVNPTCDIRLLKAKEYWSVYEATECQDE